MDKVRFAIGTSHVFQGFHRKGEGGMVGATVYLTAHVLADVVKHIQTDINSDEWNRVHNAPEPEMDALCFGADMVYDGRARVAPDGVTPLYPLTTFEASIVQRYDPDLTRPNTNIKGGWVHEDVIDSVEPWESMEAGTFKPVTHGFYIDPEMVAEGRTDAPLILTTADINAQVKYFVVDVYVPVSVSVHATDERMAQSMAEERFNETGLWTGIEAAVEIADDFVMSDSPFRFEVGEAEE